MTNPKDEWGGEFEEALSRINKALSKPEAKQLFEVLYRLRTNQDKQIAALVNTGISKKTARNSVRQKMKLLERQLFGT